MTSLASTDLVPNPIRLRPLLKIPFHLLGISGYITQGAYWAIAQRVNSAEWIAEDL